MGWLGVTIGNFVIIFYPFWVFPSFCVRPPNHKSMCASDRLLLRSKIFALNSKNELIWGTILNYIENGLRLDSHTKIWRKFGFGRDEEECAILVEYGRNGLCLNGRRIITVIPLLPVSSNLKKRFIPQKLHFRSSSQFIHLLMMTMISRPFGWEQSAHKHKFNEHKTNK